MGIVLSYAFAHIIEAVILWMSMSQMYEHRYKQWLTGTIIMIGHAVMFAVFLMGNIYFITIVNTTIYIILIKSLYKLNFKTTIFCPLLYIAMMALSELMVFYCIQYVVGVKNVKQENTLIILIVVCLCKILYFIMVEIEVWIINKNSHGKNLDYQDISFFLLMMVLISSVIVFIAFYIIGMKWQLQTRETIWMILGMIVLVLNDIIVLWVNITNNKKSEESQRIKVELEKERADAEYYKLENEKNESFEIFRHDIRNHLNAMLDIGDDEKIKNYIMDMMNIYSIGNKTSFSNSNVLNGLVSQYMKKCQEAGVNFTVDIRPDTIENMLPTDIVSMFGNILSNAFESAEKCKSKSYIDMVVKRSRNVVLIKACNSCENKPVYRDGNYITTKTDKEKRHGYGMKSIYKVVEKYNGYHAELYDENNNEFTLSIFVLINKEL